MNLKLLLFIFSVFYSITLSAQGFAESIKAMENRTLVVILESPLKTVLSRLNEHETKYYESAIENYNRKLKEVTAKFWTLNSKQEFKTWDEVNLLTKDKSNSYLLLYAGNHSVDPSINETLMQKGLKFSPSIFTSNEKRKYDDAGYYTAFHLCFLEDLKKNKPIVIRTVTNLWPLKEDIIFSWQYIQCLLLETKRTNESMDIEKVVEMHSGDLKLSTLLINGILANDDLTEDMIRSVYPHRFQIISHDTLLQRITGQESVTYIEITPLLVGTGEAYRMGYEHILINAKTGMIVGYVPVNWGVLHATAGHFYHHKFISKGIFDKYLGDFTSKPRELVQPKE